MEEELKAQLKREKYNAYYRKRNQAIREGNWEEMKKRANLDGMSEEEKKKYKYNLKVERRKQYTIEVERGKAAIFDERLKQYGDKASQIFREALDQYLDTHPDVNKLKKKMEGDK